MNQKEIEKFIKEVFSLFNQHDIEAVMSCFTDDCVFLTPGGDHIYGNKIEGKQAVRASFQNVFDTVKDAAWEDTSHVVDGDRVFSEWIYSGTDIDGNRTEVQGIDVFTIRDGKIAVKQAFRKNRPTF